MLTFPDLLIQKWYELAVETLANPMLVAQLDRKLYRYRMMRVSSSRITILRKIMHYMLKNTMYGDKI